MKTTLSLISFIAVLVLFISCEDKKDDDKNLKSFDELFENRIISVEQGVEMYQEHTLKRAEPLQPILRDIYDDSTFVDTKFIYFSLQDMKDYLSFLEHLQKENPEQDVSGLRVYFGAYPESPTMNTKDMKNPKQQTVFMVPTKNIGDVEKDYKNMNNLPFYVNGTKENPYKGEFIVIDDLMLDYKKNMRLNMAQNQKKVQKASFGLDLLDFQSEAEKVKTSTLFNEGEMSPPPIKK